MRGESADGGTTVLQSNPRCCPPLGRGALGAGGRAPSRLRADGAGERRVRARCPLAAVQVHRECAVLRGPGLRAGWQFAK